MIAVNRKYRHGDIEVWVFVVDRGEALDPRLASGDPGEILRSSGGVTYDEPDTFPSSGSLNSSTWIGRSPKQYSRKSDIT